MKSLIFWVLKHGALVVVPFLGVALLGRPLLRVSQDYRSRATAHAELGEAYKIAIERLQSEVAEIRSASRNRILGGNSEGKIGWRLDEVELYRQRIEYEAKLVAKYQSAAWRPWSSVEPDPPIPTDATVRTAGR